MFLEQDKQRQIKCYGSKTDKVGDGYTIRCRIAVIVAGNNNERGELRNQMHVTTFADGGVRWDQRATPDGRSICFRRAHDGYI